MIRGQSQAVEQAVAEGAAHHQAGRLDAAQQIYERVLLADPRNFNALHLLGVAKMQQGLAAEAINLIERATLIQPLAAVAFNNLGLAHRELGQHVEARDSFERALAVDERYVGARVNLAAVLQDIGEIDAAMEQLRTAISQDASNLDALHNLAGLLQMRGRCAEAVPLYDKVLEGAPSSALAHFNRARALDRLQERAHALAGYRTALTLDPRLRGVNYCMGVLLYAQGLTAEALDCLHRECELDPSSVPAHWAVAMAQVSAVYGSTDVANDYRAALASGLDALDKWLTPERLAAAVPAVGSYSPFYLTYDDENNRPLVTKYGDICVRVMDAWKDRNGFVLASPPVRSRLRLMIVSSHIRRHSVWNAITKGIVRSIDRSLIDLRIHHTGPHSDDQTRWASENVDHFEEATGRFEDSVRMIAADAPDVILYPEVVMEQLTAMLASIRLAPVQAATWGHPESTGLSTIDYFFSAQAFEPPEAQNYYREQLVRLPSIGCEYAPLAVSPTNPDYKALGIDLSRPVLLCPGTPYKYRPENDWVLVDIVRRVPQAQLVLFIDDNCINHTEVLRFRLDHAFKKAKLRFDSSIRFIPWLPPSEFFGLLRQSTACLDTIGFSGFNTVMQSIQCDVPLVAMEGRFMRGRFGSGIMRSMGLDELVATSLQEYVDLAARVASTPRFRNEMSSRIASAKNVLFDDRAAIDEMVTFLCGVAGRAGLRH